MTRFRPPWQVITAGAAAEFSKLSRQIGAQRWQIWLGVRWRVSHCLSRMPVKRDVNPAATSLST